MTEKVLAPAPEPSPPAKRTRDRLPLARIALVLTLIPLGLILYDIANGTLGADPVEALRRRTGWWSLTLLIATLAVTPLRRLTGWSRIIQVRKTVGLMSFVYALLHFVVYISIDQWFALEYIIEDIVERPFITAGFISFLMLIPLAITSRRDSIRRMGGKRWQRLHRLIYPAAALGVLHYFWLVKADTTKPVIFGVVLAVLLLLRVVLPAPKASKGATRQQSTSDALV